MHELLLGSATAQAAAIRARKVSSEELVREHLSRIAAVNPTVNAVVQQDTEAALAAAHTADNSLAESGPLGPFHGVPFTVKDWIETSDLICAAGLPERASYRAKRDATVVARMRAAGAILLGKTNVSETNPVYGPTFNPYDLARSPGASSSGEAAIIAACGSPMGLGSDSGGSLRYPAHCCGIATLKPTSGRVPLTGHFPRIGASHDPRTAIGPLSRHVEDLWPMLKVISGVDWRDPSVMPVPLGEPEAALAGRRIGLFTGMPGATPSAETIATVAAGATALSDAGAQVEEVTIPRIDESLALTIAYWRRAESPSWTEWIPDKASSMSADDIERSIFEWDRFRRTLLTFVEPFDAILCPVAEAEAPAHGSVETNNYIYTLPFSLTGWPVAVVRAGTSNSGMPIGLQVVARPWHEGDALAVASTLAKSLGGWQQPNL